MVLAVLMTLAAADGGALCWTSFDVPQPDADGYVLSDWSFDDEGADVTFAWWDGTTRVTRGPPTALRSERALPPDSSNAETRPVVVGPWALLSVWQPPSLTVFHSQDGGWAPTATLREGVIGARSLVALPDGGLVAAWREAATPTHIAAARFDGTHWTPLTVPAREADELRLSVDGAGTPWLTWLASGTPMVARLEGSRFKPVGTLKGTARKSVNLAHPGRDTVIAWVQSGRINLMRASPRGWSTLPAPAMAHAPFNLAVSGAPDGTLALAWTEKDAHEQFTASVARLEGERWVELAHHLQLNEGDNHVDSLRISARSRDDLLLAFDEPFAKARLRLVQLRKCAPGETPTPFVESTPPSSTWPHSIQEAVAKLLGTMDQKSKDQLRTMKREDLSRLHHGWGLGIRNGFGLWRGNSQLLQSCGSDADTCSMRIIVAAWTALQPDGGSTP